MFKKNQETRTQKKEKETRYKKQKSTKREIKNTPLVLVLCGKGWVLCIQKTYLIFMHFE